MASPHCDDDYTRGCCDDHREGLISPFSPCEAFDSEEPTVVERSVRISDIASEWATRLEDQS